MNKNHLPMLISELERRKLPPGEHIVAEERNGVIEALHRAHIAVVDRDGNLRYSSGDPHLVTFTRSCIKPIQALPVLYMGASDRYGFTEEEIAMIAASHSGEERHTTIIGNLMEKIGITENDLKCGGHEPFHKETARSLKGSFTKIHDNCSGKHTGALALCKHMGWPLDTYTDLDHPLTLEIVKLISELSDMEPRNVLLGKDGCSIPNFAIPVSKMAMLFAILMDPGGKPHEEWIERMRDVFSSNPYLIAGTGRFDTVLMTEFPGRVVSKAGAQGLQTMAVRTGGTWLGITIKIEDGSYPAAEVLSKHILREMGVMDREVTKDVRTRAKERVGSVRAFGKLKEI